MKKKLIENAYDQMLILEEKILSKNKFSKLKPEFYKLAETIISLNKKLKGSIHE